jgi:predicted nucleic acid-binding protein
MHWRLADRDPLCVDLRQIRLFMCRITTQTAASAFITRRFATWHSCWLGDLHEFLGIVTHERIYSPPTTTTKALEQVSAWLESPTVVLLSETAGYWEVLAQLLKKAKITGPRVHDGRIASLCVHHGVRELLSADRDFSRFGDLKTKNPLVTR